MLTVANAARVPLADGTVHACVTSPPYWSLRDYGLPSSHWPEVTYSPMPGLSPITVPAVDACLGLEPAPEAYVGHIVACFREVWRVLRGDGTVWVNLGDSYASSGQSGCQNMDKLGERLGCGGGHKVSENPCGRAPTPVGLKPKDLVGIPWRVAFALQADGWWLRSDVLWIKPNCMPESVRDRPTKSHEYIFLLAKNKRYYYDADAVREPQTGNTHSRGRGNGTPKEAPAGSGIKSNESFNKAMAGYTVVPGGRNRRTAWTIPTSPYGGAHYAAYPRELVRIMLKASVSERGVCPGCGKPWRRVVERETVRELARAKGRDPRNLPKYAARGVYGSKTSGVAVAGNQQKSPNITTIAWRPTCTCQGAPTRGPVRCGKCRGTGREKARDERRTPDELLAVGHQNPYGKVPGSDTRGMPTQDWPGVETGNPCPHCDGGTIEGDIWPDDVDTWPVAPSVVLDPFIGSGTTAVVCQELRQKGTPIVCVGLDLNHRYLADLARERLGLLALEAWEGGRDEDNGRGLEGLPLFSRLESPN